MKRLCYGWNMQACRSIILVCLFSLSTSLFSQFNGTAHFDYEFTEYFRRNSGGWTAGDATISIPLSDNRVIWLFGDSYIVDVDTNDNTLPCLFQIRNCMMVQDSVDRNHFITYIDSTETGIDRTTFKLTGSSQFQLLWPNHGFEYQDTVYIFFEHLDTETWELIDMYIAKLVMPGLQLVQMAKLPDRGDFSFGRCVLSDTVDGYLYIYGNKVNWIVWEPYVARCAPDGLFGPWEYWTGSEWSENIIFIDKISDLPVSPSFSVVRIDEKYYIITQENGYLTCDLGRNIYSYESESPAGPFVEQNLLYTEESKIGDRYLLTYNAFSHSFFTENNELLISYNVNDWVDTVQPHLCPSQCVNVWTDRMDADSYRPKFFRVPLGLITGTGDAQPENGNGWLQPNPVKPGKLISITSCRNHAEPLDITVIDFSGKVLYRRKNCDKFSFHSPVDPGLYFVIICCGGQTISQKLLVLP